MFEYLSYILCFGILIIFLIYIYIRLKYGFWVMQPVFHVYDYSYMFNPPGIIQHSLPEKNKYTNFKDIDTIVFSQLTSIQKKRFTNLIKTEYFHNKDYIFSPQPDNISSYFVGHNDKSFVSFFYKNEHMIDLKKGTMITDRSIIGAITSRPLNVAINNDTKEKNTKFRLYYVDYLCIDKLNRKKGISPQLIQTNHYNQRHLNKNIVVSLFKREDELKGIVPLCVYSTYGFHVDKWIKPFELTSEYKVLEINGSNFRFVYDFMRVNDGKFDILIYPDIANILELIKTKNIFVYAILCDESIICCYFYRKTCVQIEKGLEVLTCFASICNCEKDIFIQGFKISFWKIAAENFFGFCAIENVSHNNIIIDNIMLKTTPLIVSPISYFFYNFAYPTFSSEKVLIIN
jgi:hypothetical protein